MSQRIIPSSIDVDITVAIPLPLTHT